MVLKLLLQDGNYASVGAQYIPKPNGHASHAVRWMRREDQFANSLGGTHDIGWIYCLVGGNQNEALAVRLGRQIEQTCEPEHVVLDCLLNVGFHHGYVLVSRRVENNLRLEFGKQGMHALRVTNIPY